MAARSVSETLETRDNRILGERGGFRVSGPEESEETRAMNKRARFWNNAEDESEDLEKRGRFWSKISDANEEVEERDIMEIERVRSEAADVLGRRAKEWTI